MAMNHCKNVFKWDKWNCPESAFSRRRKEIATKEQAVVHAIMSASLVHIITTNCSKGILKGCKCSTKVSRQTIPKFTLRSPKASQETETTKVEWYWGGCYADVELGQNIAIKVLDEMEVGNDAQTYANLHNNLVGRTMVHNAMVRKCRCHGISGSCSLQTCWLQVSPFFKIAELIRHRYKKAIRTNLLNKVDSLEETPPITTKKIEHISNHQLVYLEKSPNYCISDGARSWPGTKGRTCSRSKLKTATHMEKRSCRNICRQCGLKVRKHVREIKKNCNCSFKWCCEVKCNVCIETVEEFYCD
ncbi:hypothetical protein FQA39_LY06196 [Lamprigera yunnana]|nr:hypothetical protein FQA39_LY06196 [Lamprigera yunnana]